MGVNNDLLITGIDFHSFRVSLPVLHKIFSPYFPWDKSLYCTYLMAND